MFSYKRNYMYECVRVHTNTMIHEFEIAGCKIEADYIYFKLTSLVHKHNSIGSNPLRDYMLWNHVCFDYYNASPHTLQYSCLDKLRVLTFMSAEHDVRVKTLLPKGANRTNLQPSSQDRCQSH